MKYKIYLLEEYEDDEDEDSKEPVMTFDHLKNRAAHLAKIAQKVYDNWDEEDRDTYAGGGICHLIADAISDYLNWHGIETQTVSSNFEQHVYCVSKVQDGIFTVDIHWSTYEKGGGFNWTKIPNITFGPSDIAFYRLSPDWRDWGQYTESD